MRQIASLSDERMAQRFAAFLATKKISAIAEQDGDEWSVWVREEDQLGEALRFYADFKADPDAKEFKGAEQKAEQLRKQEQEKRLKAQKNVVEMRNNWSRTVASGPTPLTFVLIGLSVLVALTTQLGTRGALESGPVMRALLFMDPVHLLYTTSTPVDERPDADSIALRTTDIRNGQVWRIVTPIFIHFGILHLVMNMWTMWVLGAPIERKYGTVWYGVLVIALAIPSTVSGSIAPLALGGSPFGAGMSGVLFGFFGFIWMKSIFDPGSGFYISPNMLIFITVFLVFGLTSLDEQFMGAKIDNWAHIVGLITGIAIGYAPVLLKRRR